MAPVFTPADVFDCLHPGGQSILGRMFPSRRLLRALCAVAFLCAAAGALGQAKPTSPETPLVVVGLGRGTVPLEGSWKFQTGDDMAWASPDFNDSNWAQIDISRPWGDQGYWRYSGRAWYRRHIDFKDEPAGAAGVALYLPITSCAYEVYWNGHLIGGSAAMPGASSEAQPPAAIFSLGKAERGVLAFRVYSAPMDSVAAGDQVGFTAVPRVGDIESIRNFAATDRATQVRSRLLTIAQVLIYGLLTLLGAVVWLRNRNQKLLFWMFAFLLSATLWSSVDQILFPIWLTSHLGSIFDGGTGHTLQDISLWYLLLYLLDLDRYPALVRWTRILAWTALVFSACDAAVFYLPSIDQHTRLFQILDAVLTAGFSLPEIYPLLLIAFAFRERMDPARLFVAVAAFLSNMYFVVGHTVEQGERYTRWTLYNKMTQPLFAVRGVDVSMPAILSLLLVCAIVYAVYRYMVEQGQHQTALEQEYRNARAVQQVLVPDDIPNVPGFIAHSVYKPFGEVGGDFFQIIPLNNGGMLAVIGDVSGKGMPAAMTVSLLVGTVRTLAHYTESPGEILAAMNLRMLSRSHGGFTTCLVLRLDANGTLTAANAGHISPYLAGQELALENGLPLGIAAATTYVESVFHLAPDMQLTLMTDGVVEARDMTGALFGFERTAAVSAQPAEAVATAAQQFGQDDDITVLTLTRCAV